MQREIKFRAWIGKENKFADYVTIYHDGSWGYEMTRHGTVGNYTGEYTEGCPSCDNDLLMQFTGMLDKNGKEIYEGDIIKYKEDLLLVGWHHCFASFVLNKKGWAFSHFFQEAVKNEECEVIGNIHDNPELIK